MTIIEAMILFQVFAAWRTNGVGVRSFKLARELDLPPRTVRAALGNLVADKLLVRAEGHVYRPGVEMAEVGNDAWCTMLNVLTSVVLAFSAYSTSLTRA